MWGQASATSPLGRVAIHGENDELIHFYSQDGIETKVESCAIGNISSLTFDTHDHLFASRFGSRPGIHLVNERGAIPCSDVAGYRLDGSRGDVQEIEIDQQGGLWCTNGREVNRRQRQEPPESVHGSVFPRKQRFVEASTVGISGAGTICIYDRVTSTLYKFGVDGSMLGTRPINSKSGSGPMCEPVLSFRRMESVEVSSCDDDLGQRD